LATLPEIAATTSLVGAGANAGVGYLVNGEVNPNDVILGYWTGVLTAGTGLWGTVAVNAGSGATSSWLKGDDPLKVVPSVAQLRGWVMASVNWLSCHLIKF
jgi:filamentous hemagglutinin